MTESEYWLALEYRVSRELARLPENHLRFLWCDGFQLAKTVEEGGVQWITGVALISEDDGRSFGDYEFRLRLGPGCPSDIKWSALLPEEAAADWLRVDRANKTIDITPPKASGVP